MVKSDKTTRFCRLSRGLKPFPGISKSKRFGSAKSTISYEIYSKLNLWQHNEIVGNVTIIINLISSTHKRTLTRDGSFSWQSHFRNHSSLQGSYKRSAWPLIGPVAGTHRVLLLWQTHLSFRLSHAYREVFSSPSLATSLWLSRHQSPAATSHNTRVKVETKILPERAALVCVCHRLMTWSNWISFRSSVKNVRKIWKFITTVN